MEKEAKSQTEDVVDDKAADEKEAETTAVQLGAEFDKKIKVVEDGEDLSAYNAEEGAEEGKDEKKEADEKSGKEEDSGHEEEEDVDQGLLDRAEKVGISQAKAGEFSTKADLEKTVELLEASHIEKVQSPEEKESEAKAKEEAEAKAKEDAAPYDCGLSPEEYDEGLIKVLNELGTNLKKRVVALEDGHNKNTTTLRSRSVTAHTEWLDAKVNGLQDEDLAKVYGKGEIDDFADDSDEFKARAKLDTEISRIAKDLRDNKKRVPSRNKLFNKAIENLHKGKNTKVDAKTKAKLKERAKQSLGGGSGKVSAKTAEEQALQANKEFDAKMDED